MASKRMTKAEKAKRERINGLAEDLRWLYAGAAGGAWIIDEDVADTGMLERVIPAVRAIYDIPDRCLWWVVANLDKWCIVDTLAEHLIDSETWLRYQRKLAEESSDA